MKQPGMQEYTIFSAVLENIRDKSRDKLRFAKCLNCGRLTPYTLKSVDNSEISCKSCKNQIIINR